MRILLINPPFLKGYTRQSRSPCVTGKGRTFYYPYYLAYATGALKKLGNFKHVKLFDAIANDLNHIEILNLVKKLNPDLIVVDTSTPSIYNDLNFCKELKKILPRSHITLVGKHPSTLPNEIFKISDYSVDSIVRGEHELTLIELAKALEKKKFLSLKKVKGLSYKIGRKIYHNKDRKLMTPKQLDNLPFVSSVYKEQFGIKGIKKYSYDYTILPEITILTARGCPYNCSFCPVPFKNSYRARSAENVLSEFEYIKKELPFVKEIMIEDDTFPINKERTIRICKEIIKRKIKVRWSCNARVNTDYETLRWMKKAGCQTLCVGFETPTKEVLDAIHKGTTKEMQVEFMERCRKLGLSVHGCFILGLPGDTKESMSRTLKFAILLNPYTAQFYPFMVYPWTEAYKWAKRKGYLKTEDFSKWLTKDGSYAVIVEYPWMKCEEIEEICCLCTRKFYRRFGYIMFRLMRLIKNPEKIKREIQRRIY